MAVNTVFFLAADSIAFFIIEVGIICALVYAYLSSEESAMRLVSPNLDKFWCPRGGEPVVGKLKTSNPKTAEVLAGGEI